VLIVQIDDRELSAPVQHEVPFWKYSAAINQQYARNHGYDYKYITFRDVPEGRHGAWAHVAIVRELLASQTYDYVLKLDSDAMLGTTAPLEAMIDFGPLERGEKDVALAIDAMYYDLYECPRVHNLTSIERRCGADGRNLETVHIADAHRCSSWFSVDAWSRGLHLGELRGLGNEELEEQWSGSWARTGLSELPPGATRRVFDDYGLSRRRQDLLSGGWWRDPRTSPALTAFGAFNSGVYLAKASPASVALFDDWWSAPTKVCNGASVAPRFEIALRHLTSGEASRDACTATAADEPRNAFTLRPVALEPLSCADHSLQDYLAGAGAGGSPLYEQPALSLVLPEHMARIEAYDPWDFNGPFSKVVWHPVGSAKQWRSTVQWFDQLLQQQQQGRMTSRLLGFTWEVVPEVKDCIGWLSTCMTLGLFLAPMQTVWGRDGIYRRGSTHRVASGLPYFAGFAGCLCWVLYASQDIARLIQPLVINALGLALNTSFMTCYWFFSPQRLTCSIAFVAVVASAVAAQQYAAFLGSAEPLGQLAALVNVLMLASPLAAAGDVVRTRSVSKYPFPPLLLTLVQSCSWLAFSTYIGDVSILVPNLLGVVFGVAQLGLYFYYASQGVAMSRKTSERINGSFIDIEAPPLAQPKIPSCPNSLLQTH